MPLVVALLLLVASLAWAQPTGEKPCEARAAELAHQVVILKQVRDFYEQQLAEARAQIDVARLELSKRPQPAKAE